MAQTVKNLPEVETQETRVRSLGWADPLEEGLATDSSILAWEIPWTEEPGRLQSMVHKQSDRTYRLNNDNNHIRQNRLSLLCGNKSGQRI